MKLFLSSVFAILVGMAMYAGSFSSGKIFYSSINYQKPITISVDFINTFTWMGMTCTDHVTGTVTLEYDGLNFTSVISSKLMHHISCKSGKGGDVNGTVAKMVFDSKAHMFTDVEFDQTTDEDVNKLITTSDFKTAFLSSVNSQLKF